MAYRIHDAQWFGVPQRRRRISVVADFGGSTAHEILFEPCSVSGNPTESGAQGERPAGAIETGASYAVRIRGGCDGGGKGALVQTEKSGTLGTGNDQTVISFTQNQRDEVRNLKDKAGSLSTQPGMKQQTYILDGRAKAAAQTVVIPINDKATRYEGGGGTRKNDGAGNGLGVGKDGDPAPTITAADKHIVAELKAYGLITKGNGEAILMNEKHCSLCTGGGQLGQGYPACLEIFSVAKPPVCVAFKSGQGAKAGGIGYQEEVSPTLSAVSSGSNQVPAIFDMSHANDVIRECGEVAPSLQARMGTGGNQVPLTYQQVTGTLSPGAHAGSYNGQDAYNDMLVVSSEISPTLRAKANDPYRADMAAYIASVDCRNFREGGKTNGTLQAKSNGGTSYNLQDTVRTGMGVRRLTPLECTRLQGFPDGWVDIGEWTDEKGRVHKEADAPKYKALGNSIALPFWKWLLRRISEYLPEGATLGSLFDGIGGFPLCWAKIHGAENCRWASEIEQFPIAVVKRHFGDEDAGTAGDIDNFCDKEEQYVNDKARGSLNQHTPGVV